MSHAPARVGFPGSCVVTVCRRDLDSWGGKLLVEWAFDGRFRPEAATQVGRFWSKFAYRFNFSCARIVAGGAISGGGGSTSASADVLEKGIDSIDITQELVRLRNGPLLARRM